MAARTGVDPFRKKVPARMSPICFARTLGTLSSHDSFAYIAQRVADPQDFRYWFAADESLTPLLLREIPLK